MTRKQSSLYVEQVYSLNPWRTLNDIFLSLKYFDWPKFDFLIEEPELNSNVFIDRKPKNVFEKIYRLDSIKKLNDIYTYGDSKKYNIINNF